MEACGLGKAEHKVHILHCLAGSAFQQVVYHGTDNEAGAVFLYLQEAFVCARDLLQVHGTRGHEGEGRIGIVVFVETACGRFVERALRVDGGEDAAREVAAQGDEVDFRCVSGLEAGEGAADFGEVLVGEDLVGGDVAGTSTEVGGGAGLRA